MTIKELIKNAEDRLEAAGRDANSAKLYMLHLFSQESAKVYAMLDSELDPKVSEEYEIGIKKMEQGIPLQHVTGVQAFFGRDFKVSDKVLIPRFETEELVEEILYHIDDYFEDLETIACADIGTGSGAIAITVKAEEERVKMIATDISEEALEVAKENAKNIGVDVEFAKADMLKTLIKEGVKLDILISNPPYIKQTEVISSLVKDHEPHVALYGGDDGLKFYREILENAHLVIKDKALIAFEIGYDLKEALTDILEELMPGVSYQFKKDINGNDRMLFVYVGLKV